MEIKTVLKAFRFLSVYINIKDFIRFITYQQMTTFSFMIFRHHFTNVFNDKGAIFQKFKLWLKISCVKNKKIALPIGKAYFNCLRLVSKSSE